MSIRAPGPVPDPPRFHACVALEEAAVRSSQKPPTAGLESKCRGGYEQLVRHTLGYLISTSWLIGAMGELGQGVSQREVERQFSRVLRESYPGGEVEMKNTLSETGETIADEKLKIRLELVSAKFLRLASSKEQHVTLAQVVRYYRQHRSEFVAPEVRTVEIVERSSKAEAIAVKKEIEKGRTIKSLDPLVETVTRFSKHEKPGPGSAETAIFSAKPHTVAGPAVLPASYSMFEVVSVAPPSLASLASVRDAIEQRVAAEVHSATLDQFFSRISEKWNGRTSCAPGYVVPQCSQYKGSGKAAGEELAALVE